MSTPIVIGVPVFDLRLVGVGHKQPEPYALVVAVADGQRTSAIAAGSRRDMRALRNRLLIAVRSDPECLDAVASALAAAVHRLPAEPVTVNGVGP